MNLQRIDAAEMSELGGPRAAAAHVRGLVQGGASVEEAVREIIATVRTGGDRAVLEYTRRFDTEGAEPRPLLVEGDELDAAIKALPLDLVAGLQVAIANVAQLAAAGVDDDVALTLPQGQRIVLREVPVAAAAVYVPGPDPTETSIR
jgi:histidinol dehydrogenase